MKYVILIFPVTQRYTEICLWKRWINCEHELGGCFNCCEYMLVRFLWRLHCNISSMPYENNFMLCLLKNQPLFLISHVQLISHLHNYRHSMIENNIQTMDNANGLQFELISNVDIHIYPEHSYILLCFLISPSIFELFKLNHFNYGILIVC